MSETPIQIGYDAKRIVANRTGLGNYSRYVVRALAEHNAHEVVLHLMSAHRGDPSLYHQLLHYPSVRLVLPRRRPSLPLQADYWRNFVTPREARCRGLQIYHGLSNELPMGDFSPPIPTVLTMHDLIYERLPRYYKATDRLLYRYKYRASARCATHIVAVSERTKQDLVELYGISPDKISVIYQGCDPRFGTEVPSTLREQVARKYALPEQYLLSVGTIEERKNAGLIVQALGCLDAWTNIHLVLVGRRTPYTRQVEQMAAEAGLTERLHIIDRATLEELPALYAGAMLFVYPSRYEGFGIPIVEALRSGVPVIGAEGSCLQEAGGPDSLYCAPDSADSLAEKIEAVLTQPQLAQQMSERGRMWSERFAPEILSRQLTTLYRSLI